MRTEKWVNAKIIYRLKLKVARLTLARTVSMGDLNHG